MQEAPCAGEPRGEVDQDGTNAEVSRVEADRSTRGLVDRLAPLYGVWFLVYLGIVVLRPVADDRFAVLADAALLPLSAGATLAAWLTSRAAGFDDRERRAWRLVAVAVLAYAIGDAISLTVEVASAAPLFPSAADVAYLVFYPAMMAALLAFSDPISGRERRITFALDASIVMVASTIFVAQLLLRPLVLAAAAAPIRLLAALAYPTGDLVLLFGVISLCMRRSRYGSSAFTVSLVAAISVFFCADAIFVVQNANGNYQSGAVPDAIYAASYALTVAAGWFARRRVGQRPARASSADDVVHISRLPYVAVAAAFALLLVVPVADQPTLVVGWGGLSLLVVLRQIVATRRLELVQRELLLKNEELARALSDVKALQGMLPICSYCKSIRSDENYWEQIESYITANTDARLSHGICPDCYARIVKPELERYKERRASDLTPRPERAGQ